MSGNELSLPSNTIFYGKKKKKTSIPSNPGTARSSVSADTRFNMAFALGALVNVIVKCGNTCKLQGV